MEALEKQKSWSKPYLLSGRGRQGLFQVQNWLLLPLLSAEWMLAPVFFRGSYLQLSPLNHSWWGEKAAQWCSGSLWCNYQQAEYMYFLCSGTCLLPVTILGLWRGFWVHGSECKVSSQCFRWNEGCHLKTEKCHPGSWVLSLILENDSEVEETSISLKTQRVKFRTEL